jgi:hypothetical protein
MKVSELIALLQMESPDSEVHIAYGSGDHWHTTVAPSIDRVETTMITYSDYHRMDQLISDEEDAYDEGTGNLKPDVRTVVVLS